LHPAAEVAVAVGPKHLGDDAAIGRHDALDALGPDEDSLALRRRVDGAEQSPEEGG
jgi:hypothetical protein